jgi:hypothetical protein
MPQKLSSFLRQSWFPILTLIGMLIHGYYTMNYAQRDSARDILEIRSAVVELKQFGSVPLKSIEATVVSHTNELAEMKKFIFKYDRTINRLERNVDRVTWVVEELAKKQGISPPKQLPDSNFE